MSFSITVAGTVHTYTVVPVMGWADGRGVQVWVPRCSCGWKGADAYTPGHADGQFSAHLSAIGAFNGGEAA